MTTSIGNFLWLTLRLLVLAALQLAADGRRSLIYRANWVVSEHLVNPDCNGNVKAALGEKRTRSSSLF